MGDEKYSLLYFIPATLFFLGLGSFFYSQTALIYNPITKYIIAPALLALGASIAHAVAGQIINVAIEAPADVFMHTQAILTVFSMPLVLAIAFAFFGFYFIFLLFINTSKLKDFEFIKGYTPITILVRITTFLCAWILILNVLNNYSEPYSKKLERVAKWSIYNLEAELFSYCEKEDTQRISYVSSDIVVISEEVDGEYKFEMQKCQNKF